MKYIYNFLVLLMCLSFYSKGVASVLTETAIHNLETQIQSEIKKQKIAGLSYAITKNGKVIYEGAQGVRDVEGNSPFTLETRTSLGSITKTIIGLGVYSLINANAEFNIEQKVSSILPWFNRKDLSGITVKHLLNHTSGLQRSLGRDSIANLDLMYNEGRYGPLYSDIFEITKDIELMYPVPGVMPQYSNFAYALLGSIIVKVAEESGFKFLSVLEEEKLAEYMRDQVFKPLGLEKHMDLMVPSRDFSKESVVYTGTFGDVSTDKWAYRYVWPVISNLGMAVAHSGVISDVQGLAKLNIALDNMVTGSKYKILNPDLFSVMTKMEARSFDLVAKETNWGYGNGGVLYEKIKTNKREFLAVGHTGTGYGARTLMFLDPTTGVGVSLIINDKSSNRHAFAHLLFDAIYEKSNFNAQRMNDQFKNNYFEAKNKINQSVALTSEQKGLFPNISSSPLTAKDLYEQLQKASGKVDVFSDLKKLGELDFISGSFGAGSAYSFSFFMNDIQIKAEDLTKSQLNKVVVKGRKGGKDIPLFRDLSPEPSESLIREGFSSIFLLFSFQQLDFSYNNNGELAYLVFDRTFYQKARTISEQDQPLEVFPQARKVNLINFPYQ